MLWLMKAKACGAWSQPEPDKRQIKHLNESFAPFEGDPAVSPSPAVS